MNKLGGMLDSGRRAVKAEPPKPGDDSSKVIESILSRTAVTVAYLPADDAEAVGWYRKAAEAGHVGAMSNLGLMLASGRGTARDDVEAVAWYRKAAKAGNPGAMVDLGDMLMTGRGAARDEIEASNWLSKAAAQFPNAPMGSNPPPPPPRPSPEGL